jgi:mono/diheme cytochrome c family protein
MSNIIILLTLITVAVLLLWLSNRAWRIKNVFLRWSGASSAGILATASLLVCLVAVIGLYKQHIRSAPVPDLKVEGSLEQLQRGQAIADTFCGGCHSTSGTLTGGLDVGNDLPVRLGSFIAPNLTHAGPLGHWSDGKIFRAIRNGVDANGHWLTIMSFTNAGKLSDADIQALIAYIRHQPAAGSATREPPDRFNFLGLLMLGAGQFPLGNPVYTGVITAPPKTPNIEYGAYILSYQDCRQCHGSNLTGGVAGQLAPIGPDLRVVKSWSRDEFLRTLRTGKDPNGHGLSEQMPWRPIGKMDDVELSAVYQYLTHMADAQSPEAN